VPLVANNWSWSWSCPNFNSNLGPRGVVVRSYADILTAYADLRAGAVVGVIQGSTGAQYILRDRRLRARIVQYFGDPLDQEGFAFPKGSALVAVVNAALHKVEANGTYLKIYRRWFGADPVSIP
jgi:glutamine transport system substrate-binding protein